MISTISPLGMLYFELDCSFLRVMVFYLAVLAREELASGSLACFFSIVRESLLFKPLLPLLSECLAVLSTI